MLSVVKRFNLILLFLVLSFGIEENYCSESNFAQGQNIEPQAQEVDVCGRVIVRYILYEGLTNFFYWFFDWYQKKPGWYWYKNYRSFGYRTCLLSNRFYFDFYMRTWINIISTFCILIYNGILTSSSTSPMEKEYASNMLKACLCFMFVPVIDLNMCFGDKFYLVIGFRDIIMAYFLVKERILDNQIKEKKRLNPATS